MFRSRSSSRSSSDRLHEVACGRSESADGVHEVDCGLEQEHREDHCVRYGNTIRLYCTSSYTANRHGGYVGLFETVKSKEVRVAIPPFTKNQMQNYTPSDFTVKDPEGVKKNGEKLLYGDVVQLVDQNGHVWNNNQGPKSYIGRSAPGSRCEMYMKLVKEDDPGKRQVVGYGDFKIHLDVLTPSRVLLKEKYHKYVTNFRSDNSKIEGGYLVCDGRGLGVTFAIHHCAVNLAKLVVRNACQEPFTSTSRPSSIVEYEDLSWNKPLRLLMRMGSTTSNEVLRERSYSNSSIFSVKGSSELEEEPIISITLNNGDIAKVYMDTLLVNLDEKCGFWVDCFLPEQTQSLTPLQGTENGVDISANMPLALVPARSSSSPNTGGCLHIRCMKKSKTEAKNDLSWWLRKRIFIAAPVPIALYVVQNTSHRLGLWHMRLPRFADYVDFREHIKSLLAGDRRVTPIPNIQEHVRFVVEELVTYFAHGFRTHLALVVAASLVLFLVILRQILIRHRSKNDDNTAAHWEKKKLALMELTIVSWNADEASIMRTADEEGESKTPPMPQRFLNAEAGDEAKARKRWIQTCKWREERGAEECIYKPHPDFALLKNIYPHFYHGRDRQGNIVYYECPGGLDINRFRALGMSKEKFVDHIMYQQEYLWRVLQPKEHHRVTAVIDMGGVSSSYLFKSDLIGILKAAVATTGEHYPERSFKIIILNVPGWFGTLFKIIKPLLNEVQKAKINIFKAAEMHAGLLKIIDNDNIPKCYGGKSPDELGNWSGELQLTNHVLSTLRNANVCLNADNQLLDKNGKHYDSTTYKYEPVIRLPKG